MLLRNLCTAAVALGLTLIISCGGDDDDGSSQQLGGGVGAACDTDAQCTGYAKAACVTEIKPLEDLVALDGSASNKVYHDMSLPFPGGYCASTIDNACTAHADCGSDGKCFLAFEGVSQEVINNLNKLGLPFDVSAFAQIGICLKPCTSDGECRADQKYKCLRPLDAFMKVINGSYSQKFCVQDKDFSYLLSGGAPDGG
jgi:hypothetical protein